ncbi:MAG: hypothetical protein ORO03_06605 [Alphaproteobacteria bacterium]|nr:hypothetical protein [Alphaproteobacteria bacterium]
MKIFAGGSGVSVGTSRTTSDRDNEMGSNSKIEFTGSVIGSKSNLLVSSDNGGVKLSGTAVPSVGDTEINAKNLDNSTANRVGIDIGTTNITNAGTTTVSGDGGVKVTNSSLISDSNITVTSNRGALVSNSGSSYRSSGTNSIIKLVAHNSDPLKLVQDIGPTPDVQYAPQVSDVSAAHIIFESDQGINLQLPSGGSYPNQIIRTFNTQLIEVEFNGIPGEYYIAGFGNDE